MKKIFLSLIISSLLIIGFHNINNKSLIDNHDINYSTEDSKYNEIANNQIFATIENHFSWAIDPTIPENLIADSSSIVKIKVLSINESMFIDSLNYDGPLTPINVEVIETLSGSELPDSLDIYKFGGIVSISKLIEHQPEETTRKMGIDKIDKSEQNVNFIKYSSESDYDFKIGEEYVVILNKQANGIYTISAEGYGTFNLSNKEGALSKSKASTNTYTNVLTGKTFEFK